MSVGFVKSGASFTDRGTHIGHRVIVGPVWALKRDSDTDSSCQGIGCIDALLAQSKVIKDFAANRVIKTLAISSVLEFRTRVNQADSTSESIASEALCTLESSLAEGDTRKLVSGRSINTALEDSSDIREVGSIEGTLVSLCLVADSEVPVILESVSWIIVLVIFINDDPVEAFLDVYKIELDASIVNCVDLGVISFALCYVSWTLDAILISQHDEVLIAHKVLLIRWSRLAYFVEHPDSHVSLSRDKNPVESVVSQSLCLLNDLFVSSLV